MRSLLYSVVALLVGGSTLMAQSINLPPRLLGARAVEGEKKDQTPPAPITGAAFTGNGAAGTRSFWADAEFLLWSFKKTPVSVPLVTTSNQADQGIIGNPSTVVLFGDRSIDHEWRNGYRLTVGGWLDSERQWGVEATGFYFAGRTNTDFTRSTTSPTQILAIPFNNVSPAPFTGSPSGGPQGSFVTSKAGENALLIGGSNDPANRIGTVVVTTSASFWGTELNGLFNLARTERGNVHFLFGFRYADLRETLNMYVQNDTTNAAGVVTTPPNRQVTFYDHFGTRNQFYGGNLGLKGEWRSGVWFANATAKVALGGNHQSIDIDGTFSDPQPFFIRNYGVGKGGILTAATNSGNTSRNRFSVLPEAQVNIGAYLTRNIKAFAGYDFVYLSSVVRPGDQIDRNLNLTQFASGPVGTTAALIGQASPALSPRSSSFFAHGANFGLAFEW